MFHQSSTSFVMLYPMWSFISLSTQKLKHTLPNNHQTLPKPPTTFTFIFLFSFFFWFVVFVRLLFFCSSSFRLVFRFTVVRANHTWFFEYLSHILLCLCLFVVAVILDVITSYFFIFLKLKSTLIQSNEWRFEIRSYLNNILYRYCDNFIYNTFLAFVVVIAPVVIWKIISNFLIQIKSQMRF